jgi:hypothetical protein
MYHSGEKMTKKLFILLINSAIVLSFSVSTFAWDDTGHKVSAYIAWQQMTPDVREKVFKILMKAPEDSDLSVYYNFFDSRSPEVKKLELFMIAATWADIVRNNSFKVREANYNQPDWHYGDIFWKQENGNSEILQDFPEESGKAIPKLHDFENILRDSTVADSEKAIAIAWFLHVGGDIHNPLHNASRVTDLEPKGDQGGNKFLLTPDDAPRKTNLHSYWDTQISRNMMRKNDACDSDYILNIGKKIIKKYPFQKLQDRIKAGDFEAWNREGFDLLNTQVYTIDLKRGETPSKNYSKSSFKVGQEQIALAGYRLGTMLNSIFSTN